MQYSDIKSKARFLTSTNSSSFVDADIVVLANNAVEHIEGLINNADSRWQFDDSNQTDLPIATTSLVSGQQDYALATSHISIDRVEVLDQNNNWTLLRPIDEHDIRFEALPQHLKANGIPLEYDKLANSIFLYPIPNYSLAASLKIYFTRPPVAFVVGDTTAVPGFNPIFHDLVAYWIAYEFAIANGKGNLTTLFQAIQEKEQHLYDFYGQRSRDERPRMNVSSNGLTGNSSGIISGILASGISDSNR